MLLSILVPTKNNPTRLVPLIQGFRDWVSSCVADIELVLVDNSDVFNDEVSELGDETIRYEWSNKSLDILANFDRAISLSRGDYCCIIGDDDCVLPSIEKAVVHLRANNIDAGMCEVVPYYWPKTATYWVKQNRNGYLVKKRIPEMDSICDLNDGLRKLLDSGGCNYKPFLPSVYHGLVKTSVLRELVNKYGTSFPGPSPDISNAVLLASSHLTCYRYSAFIVSGAASGSAAAEGAIHAHHGSLEQRTSFIDRGGFKWPSDVPQFFCGPTMWSVSVVNTLNFLKKDATKYAINSARLHARCLVFHSAYRDLIIKSLLKQSVGSIVKFPIFVLVELFVRVKKYLGNSLLHSRRLHRYSKYVLVRNIADTSEVINHYNAEGVE